MFNHAIRHPVKKALTDIRNNEGLTPLSLSAKIGRKDLFLQCLELSHVVNIKISDYGMNSTSKTSSNREANTPFLLIENI
jgi:hypothetical protein